MRKYTSILFAIILSSVALCDSPKDPRKNVPKKEITTEDLLQNYNPVLAKKASKMIKGYSERKNTSSRAMTNVAKTIFKMYGLNPKDITASYGGTVSKAVIDKNNKGKVRIYVSERRKKELEHYAKAYGNDTFLHEMLHALGFKWKANGVVKTHGLSHSNKEEKIYFEKCRKLLVSAVYGKKKNTKNTKETESVNKDSKEVKGEDKKEES